MTHPQFNINRKFIAISISKGEVLDTVPPHGSPPRNPHSHELLAVIEPLIMTTVKGALPDSLVKFKVVFNQEAFLKLSARRASDLQIYFIPNKIPSWGKVYPTTNAQGIILKKCLTELMGKMFHA